MWAPLMEGFAPDLPGHRDVAPPAGTFEGEIDALAAHLEEPRGVAGYSMGARLALGLAIRHPARVRWLLLDGASLGLRREADRAERQMHDARWAELLRTEGIEAFARAWEAQPIFGGAASVRERRDHRPGALAEALERLGKGRMPWLGEAAGALRCPVVLLNGDRDEKGLAEAQAVAECVPHSVRIIIPGHHAAHLEAPAAWRERVRRSLSRIPKEVTA
jgi:2-succinyl-6-hydroxy-2,4-cyclohexadiene-1-carboxylate synthase